MNKINSSSHLTKETVLGTIILILCIIVFILVIQLIQYMKKPSLDIEPIATNFFLEIRPIRQNMNEEAIYNLEGKKEDEIETTQDGHNLIYYNAQMNDYIGTLKYCFQSDKMTTVKFLFENRDDYDKYIKEFVSKYSEGYEIYRDGWYWIGILEDEEVGFSTHPKLKMVEKHLYYNN